MTHFGCAVGYTSITKGKKKGENIGSLSRCDMAIKLAGGQFVVMDDGAFFKKASVLFSYSSRRDNRILPCSSIGNQVCADRGKSSCESSVLHMDGIGGVRL